MWYSISTAKEPDYLYIEPEVQPDYGPDPLLAIVLMKDREALKELDQINLNLEEIGDKF